MRIARVLPVLLLVDCIAPVLAQEIPKNDGWVTDLGDFLTPEQERSKLDSAALTPPLAVAGSLATIISANSNRMSAFKMP